MEFNQLREFYADYSGLIKAFEYAKVKFEPIVTSDFSVFKWIPFDENQWSRIIAYFLNPNESHGQGNVFLNEFLKYLSAKVNDSSILNEVFHQTKDAQVYTEANLGGRRVDILIRLNNSFNIGIENKIWAGNQNNQLTDYAKALEKVGNNFLLILLAPYDKRYTEDSLNNTYEEELTKNSQFLRLSLFSDFVHRSETSNASMLERWINNSKSEKVRTFLLDLNQHLKTRILNESDMSAKDDIKKFLLDSNNLVISVNLLNDLKTIEKELLNKFNQIAIFIQAEIQKIDAPGIVIWGRDKNYSNSRFSWQGSEKINHTICFGIDQEINVQSAFAGLQGFRMGWVYANEKKCNPEILTNIKSILNEKSKHYNYNAPVEEIAATHISFIQTVVVQLQKLSNK